MYPVMNNTKWEELRLAMYALEPSPRWSTTSANGYRSKLDDEWLYHFRIGGYDHIVHVDILAHDDAQRDEILRALRHVHVPGEAIDGGFRVFGLAQRGKALDYL